MDEEPRTKKDSYVFDYTIPEHPGLNFFPLSLTTTNIYLKHLCDDVTQLGKKMEILDSYVQKNEWLAQRLHCAEQEIDAAKLECITLQKRIKKLKAKK